MNYRYICTAAKISYLGLRTAHNAAGRLGHGEEEPNMERAVELYCLRLLYFRHIMLEIANIADVASTARALYKDHPELGELHGELSQAFEFFKYIRNKYVGHLVPELVDKTFEWLPQSFSTLGDVDESNALILSWFVLETVINTYTDPSTGHRVFDTETDLNYPPDQIRFFDYLGETAEKAMVYAELLSKVAATYVEVPDMKEEWFKLAMQAGATEFSYLAKKGR
ncbi:hypothetical protein C8N42_11355 [Celeribacter persicus]|uniref:Uncharacterized protein n=2 Tax=Celeribacter persicus TaxID=1651082 RepID=A0A2T5HBJ1_9RHOB|nr:hypothetical protein C8N42_11355 [Celeribacter persicus]